MNAGVLLLSGCLAGRTDLVVRPVLNGWPEKDDVLDGADALVLFVSGGAKHPLAETHRLDRVRALLARGVGLICIHHALEIPREVPSGEFLQWMGGYFEPYWSVNPIWNAYFRDLPSHPITSGVQPFSIRDEWYFNIRFFEQSPTLKPILVATPPDETRTRRFGSHTGNAYVRSRIGQPEVLAWTLERPDGGRSFGFTGGHYHRNWADHNFRLIVLNAVLWAAKIEVPTAGVNRPLDPQALEQNLDPKPIRVPKRYAVGLMVLLAVGLFMVRLTWRGTRTY
jgi:type 1 glutamine amidotransferase